MAYKYITDTMPLELTPTNDVQAELDEQAALDLLMEWIKAYDAPIHSYRASYYFDAVEKRLASAARVVARRRLAESIDDL